MKRKQRKQWRHARAQHAHEYVHLGDLDRTDALKLLRAQQVISARSPVAVPPLSPLADSHDDEETWEARLLWDSACVALRCAHHHAPQPTALWQAGFGNDPDGQAGEQELFDWTIAMILDGSTRKV